MSRVFFEEVRCRSALNRVRARRMSFDWSLNPYRGCGHACVYCYAREYHRYLERDGGREFEQRVLVKVNVARVLRRELRRRSWRRELVAIGTATDAYQAAEGKYRLTRRCLEAFLAQLTPVSIATKSTLVLRDRELLAELARAAGASVMFSLTTLRPELARRLEPDTPPPAKRLAALAELGRAGVRVGVALAPILPGLTDDEANMEEVCRAAMEHGARFLFASPLRLTPVPRQTYLDFLAGESAPLREATARLYAGAYAPDAYRRMVEQRVEGVKRRLGMNRREAHAPCPMPHRVQLTLGLWASGQRGQQPADGQPVEDDEGPSQEQENGAGGVEVGEELPAAPQHRLSQRAGAHRQHQDHRTHAGGVEDELTHGAQECAQGKAAADHGQEDGQGAAQRGDPVGQAEAEVAAHPPPPGPPHAV